MLIVAIDLRLIVKIKIYLGRRGGGIGRHASLRG